MRKLQIGLFSIFTAFLFLVSVSASVSAHDPVPFQEVNMETYIYSNSPFVDVNFEIVNPPTHQAIYLVSWAQPTATWTLDIDNDDDIEIKSTCTWEDYYSPPGQNPTGYHEYTLEAIYTYGVIEINHDTDFNKYTYGAADPPETDSQDIGVIFYGCQEGATIDVTWTVYAKNLFQSTEENPVEATAVVYGEISLT